MTHTALPTVEQWGVQEIVCPGFATGNPYMDYQIRGVFASESETVEAPGFYDGDGRYVVRFMPSHQGRYTYRVFGSFSHEEYSGSFQVTAPAPGVHGPVRVSDQYHFAYADGTRYMPVGTTCYVWHLQTPEIFERTLESLKTSPFNKIRFCVFPKDYDYNKNDPFTFPFEKAQPAPGERYGWDFTRFDPAYFRHLEKAIQRLCDIGVEADIIVLHPYDRWGFSRMPREVDQRYFRYLASRIAAYRNVWWSLANEYDLMPAKCEADWESCAAALKASDPYGRLMSIHNCFPFYDHTRPWVTHCCLQRQELYRSTELVDEWRERFGKPVIVDEMGYEGDIQHGWGNLTAEEVTRRFWEATVRGGYGGHGETYLNEKEILWWSHGDVLHGQSPARLQFLRDFLEALPAPLMRTAGSWDEVVGTAQGCTGEAAPFYLYYYSFMRPTFRDFRVPEGMAYQVEVIDTWNMTRTDCGVKEGSFRVPLPARQYVAVYLKRVR
ncbi:MAG: DUF4038 domain-containing protein [Clostridiales bacterium]|nr:DUF4038 domain-containing protein [Clostridiales bacterium]